MNMHKKNVKWRWLKGFLQKHVRGMITCREFEEFVAGYVAGELPSHQRSQFELHIRFCRECAQYLQAYQRTIEIDRVLFQSSDGPVPNDVPEDLVRAILKVRNE